MKHNGPRYIAAVLVCTMLVSLLPAQAMAQREASEADPGAEAYVEEEAEGSGETATGETDEEPAGGRIVADFVEDIPDNDELFAGYAQQLFYPELAAATYADYAQRCLSDEEYAIYAVLEKEVKKIAAGKRASTIINVPSISEDSVKLIYYCLLVDCPYEMYWHDKTQGCYLYRPRDGALQLWFTVAEGYADADVTQLEVTQAVARAGWSEEDREEFESAKNRCYTIDTAKAQRATTAKANADEIVTTCADLSDKEKLTAYENAICALTSYNKDAAYNADTPYGDPWQMIYVFDRDDSTNVVCEGYAKAFQYLCDRSTFEDDSVQCYTVTGTMNGGAHMWNIVTLGGKNYLVDVTNSDEGSVGEFGDLFLAEGYSVEGYGYTKYLVRYRTSADAEPTQWVWYDYDKETVELYDESVLTLAGTQIRAAQTAGQDENDAEPQKAHVNGGVILLVCGAGLVGLSAAAAVYFFYYKPVTLAGVACAANGEALPYAIVRLLRGGRVLATVQADANGAYTISARGADTLEVTYIDSETGEAVTTRQALGNWPEK